MPQQLEARRRMLDDGVTSVGWKVGFGAPSALDMMRLTAPLMGFLTDATLLETGSTVDTASWIRGIVEFEVAVYLGSDLAGEASDAEVYAAVAAVGPAIELANIDLPIGADSVPEIVAGNIFHEGLILGPPDTGRSGLNTEGLVAQIAIDDVTRATTAHLEEITGSYPWIVSNVAGTLAAFGERLRAGDVIITGSVIPPIPVTEGREFTFTLDPLDPISVFVG